MNYRSRQSENSSWLDEFVKDNYYVHDVQWCYSTVHGDFHQPAHPRGEGAARPEDQWSCKRSPESAAYTNKHV